MEGSIPLSKELANKSVQAAIAAIEIYNKPNFSFREEAFSLLMTNAWELLLKGKWLSDNHEEIQSLTEFENGKDKIAKKNRSGNSITFGLSYLAAKLSEDGNSGLERACYENILALVEIRDNSAHFVNKDVYLGRRILEIGTASLRNFLQLATEWFQIDFSAFNFFLMPISFYHGFETVESVSVSKYSDQIKKLIEYLDELGKKEEPEGESNQHIALRLETKLVRGKSGSGVPFRWTDDPSVPGLIMREEDVLKNYPWIYQDLREVIKRRYEDFIENQDFHQLRKKLEKEKKFAIIRALNPSNPKTAKQVFYNANILQEFDLAYKRRVKH